MARLRRVVVDSDDDIDFPSLQALRTAPPDDEVATRPRGLREEQAHPGTKTPKITKLEDQPATVRRRRLCPINNDESLLRPRGQNGRQVPDSQLRNSNTAKIDLPAGFSPEQKRRKSRFMTRAQRTTKKSRSSEDDDDDTSEVSTAEVAVLENVRGSGEAKSGCDNDSSTHPAEHNAADNVCGEDEIRPDGNEGDDHDDDADSNDDDDASEFQDSSSEEDNSIGLPENLLGRPPSKRHPASKTPVSRPIRGGEPKCSNDITPYTDEGSSVFFSAEESLPALCARPLAQLSL